MISLPRVLVATAIAASMGASAACTPTGRVQTKSSGASGAPPSTSEAREASRMLGLTDGIVLAYDTFEEGNRVGMFVTQLRKRSETEFELVTAGRAKRIEIVADGVRRVEGGAYLLRWPLAADARWPGESGATVRIDAVGVVAEVPAGRFGGCIRTVEEGGSLLQRTTTLYCPDVGIAVLEAVAVGTSGPAERAVLRSRGPAVDLGGTPQ